MFIQRPYCEDAVILRAFIPLRNSGGNALDPAGTTCFNELMNRNILKTFLIAIPIIILSVGLKLVQDDGRLLYVSSEDSASMQATFYRFSDSKERKIGLNPKDRLLIDWEEEEKSGSLILEIYDPAGVLVETLTEPRSGHLLKGGQKGNYKLKVIGEKARGSFSLSWTYLPAGTP
jgi:hypothetical protein